MLPVAWLKNKRNRLPDMILKKRSEVKRLPIPFPASRHTRELGTVKYSLCHLRLQTVFENNINPHCSRKANGKEIDAKSPLPQIKIRSKQ